MHIASKKSKVEEVGGGMEVNTRTSRSQVFAKGWASSPLFNSFSFF